MKKTICSLVGVFAVVTLMTSCNEKADSTANAKDAKAVAAADGNTGATATGKNASDPVARVNQICDLQLKLTELQLAMQEELAKNGETMSTEDFAAYYKKISEANIEGQKRIMKKQQELGERQNELQETFMSEKFQKLMQSPEVNAVNEEMTKKMQELFDSMQEPAAPAQ